MSLYLKYRPEVLSEIRGNVELVSTLQNMLSDIPSCPHSFLLHGPTGCGKTTIGRIIANELGCKGNDFREVDSADFRGIDTVREIRKQCLYKALEGSVRVWLIDECHKMTNDAQNALLKILEDTPEHVYFILATTEPQKLLKTIKGRCSQFAVSPLNNQQVIGLVRSVVKKEGESLPKVIYEQIAKSSEGHPRNALQILEQVLNVAEDERLEVSKRSEERQAEIIELCRALVNRKGWKIISGILVGLKTEDPESIRRVMLGYCQAILLKKDDTYIGRIMEEFIEPFYNTGFPGLTYACYAVVKN